MRCHFLLLLSAVAICAGGIPAYADDPMEAVVVTATRTEQPLARTGESESVLTGSTLQSLQTVSLTDALALTPGIAVDQAGGLGQPTTISIRGAETGQTLVLIDGVRVNDPSGTDDGAVLGDVLVNNIDRVEILRGPQSTLYGSDAIGGVVNIISKRGGDSPFALDASAEGGSFDTYHFNAAANGSAGDFDYGVAANYLHSNGISAADKRNGNPETDGYGNFGLTENLRWHIAGNVSLDLRSYYTNARSGFDDNSGFVPPYPVFDSGAYNTDRLLSVYGGVNIDLFDGQFHNRFAVMQTRSDREFYNSFFDTIHLNDLDKGRATRFEYQGVIDPAPDFQLTFGAETQRTAFVSDFFDSFSAFDSFGKGHDTINGYYAEVQGTLFDALTLTGGVRYDDNQQFGHHTSVKAAAAYDFGEGTVLHANYGDGFKAPSLYELFSQFGNPALAPETAHGWEAGLDQSLLDGRLRGGITYFERRTSDLIDFAGISYFNVAQSRATGVEVEATAALTDTFSISANYTNLEAKDLTTGLALSRRPRNTFSATANWMPQSNWGLGASLNAVSGEVDQYSGTTAFANGGHTTANLFGHYDFDRWSIYARIENLFDARYEPLLSYGAPGRAVYAGIRLSE